MESIQLLFGVSGPIYLGDTGDLGTADHPAHDISTTNGMFSHYINVGVSTAIASPPITTLDATLISYKPSSIQYTHPCRLVLSNSTAILSANDSQNTFACFWCFYVLFLGTCRRLPSACHIWLKLQFCRRYPRPVREV